MKKQTFITSLLVVSILVAAKAEVKTSGVDMGTTVPPSPNKMEAPAPTNNLREVSTMKSPPAPLSENPVDEKITEFQKEYTMTAQKAQQAQQEVQKLQEHMLRLEGAIAILTQMKDPGTTSPQGAQ